MEILKKLLIVAAVLLLVKGIIGAIFSIAIFFGASLGGGAYDIALFPFPRPSFEDYGIGFVLFIAHVVLSALMLNVISKLRQQS